MIANTKRGQLTLFIIIGVIAVVGIAGYFAVSQGVFRDSAASQFPEINSLVEECLEEVALDGIYFNSLQGGYYDLPVGSIQSGFIELPVYFDNGINLPELAVWEEELEKYIEDNLALCLDFSDFQARGYEVEVGSMQGVEVSIRERSVNVDVELRQPILVSFEETSAQFAIFRESVDFDYAGKYNVLKEFLEIQATDSEFIFASMLEELGREYNFATEINAITQSDHAYYFDFLDQTKFEDDIYTLAFGVRY